MKSFIQFIFSLVPFLEPYPLWVKFIGALTMLSAAIFLIGFLFFKPSESPIAKEATTDASLPAAEQKHEGSGDNVAGNKVVNNYYDTEPPVQKTKEELKPTPQKRELIRRTAHELLSFYTPERTTQEAKRLMQPYLGEWIEVSGVVLDVGHGTPDGDQMAVILKSGNDQIECRFRKQWKEKLERIAKGEQLRIVGKIRPTQDKSQLYLSESEIQ